MYLHYKIRYSCISHIGNVRGINQDNFICDGQYLKNNKIKMDFPICGTKIPQENPVFGIFDGMGGEECGEVASYIASKDAAEIVIGKEVTTDLLRFCYKVNNDICDYTILQKISMMGTTAAMLVFTGKKVALCNIGDSKIFRLRNGILEQISVDHVVAVGHGMKPPLSQNLGIPPNELIIDPYIAQGSYNNGDIYLVCSDGLTDMVSTEEITKILICNHVEEAITLLLDTALANGGRDNITIILCEIQRQTGCLFNRKHNS